MELRRATALCPDAVPPAGTLQVLRFRHGGKQSLRYNRSRSRDAAFSRTGRNAAESWPSG